MFRSVPDQLERAEFVQLYSKMAQSLGMLGVVGNSPSTLLSIQIPGVVVKPGLNPKDPETEYYVSNFLNLTLECNYVATAKAALVSDVYKLILDGKELPLIDLSPSEKAKLDAARSYLFDAAGEPTPAYVAYLFYGQRFLSAQDALETAQATFANGGPAVPKSVRKAYERASEEWFSRGNKVAVEDALAVIEQLEGRDPFPYWNALAKRFRLYTRTLANGSDYQWVTSLPPYENWFDLDLWTPFSFDPSDLKNQPRSGGTGMQGDGCCCCSKAPVPVDPGAGMRSRQAAPPAGFGPGFGLNRPGAGARHDALSIMSAWEEASPETEEFLPRAAADGELRLECSFKRINILRPWIDANVFASRFWRWSPQSIGWGITVSTGGTVAGNQPATGIMPVLPTTALLAKDIKVSFASPRAAEWAESRLGAGRSVRYGPFLLDRIGRAPAGTLMASGAPARAQMSGAPQIFGYISTIFPESPNPDLTIPWPS